MTVEISRSELNSAVERVRAAALDKSPHPYAASILIEPRGQQVRFGCMHVALSAETFAPGSGDGAAIAVPVSRLSAIVGALGDGRCKLAIDAERWRLTLSSGGRRFQLSGLSGADFPRLTQMPKEGGVKLPAAPLSDLAKRLRSFESTDASKPELRGVMLSLRPGSSGGSELHAAATDGYVLAHSWVPIETPGSLGCFLPSGALDCFAAAREQADSATLEVVGSTVYLQVGSTTIAALLPQNPFPPWEESLGRYVRRPFARVPTPALIDSIRALLAARDKADPNLRMRIGDDAVLRLSIDGDSASAADEVPVSDTKPTSALVGSVILLEMLRAANADVILSDAEGILYVSTDDYEACAMQRTDPR